MHVLIGMFVTAALISLAIWIIYKYGPTIK